YDTEGERILWQYVKEEYDSDFFFVNRFPFKVKPFYVMKEDETWARSVDLLYKGLELSSGGQREHRYDVLMSQIKEKGLDPGGLEWFTKFFAYGAPPHGGFAIGIERLLMKMLDLSSVKEASLFPRDPDRILP
ncbi:MAG: amino acid--tRNA ligase-related protein, partial [Candidatus Korarchaeum sp.]